MISHRHRVIFIHVPKTAGTSVESALGHHGAAGIVRGVQDHRSLRQLQWPHGGVAQFTTIANTREAARAVKCRLRTGEHEANRLTVTRAQFCGYHKFAIIRNPWSRAYSWYCNVLADAAHRRRLHVPTDLDFAAFVETYAGTGLLAPQTEWLVDFRGRIAVDTICRFESLEVDYAAVCHRVGLPDAPLPRLNAGGVGQYVDAYDDHTRRVVAERHHGEIDLFGYTFGT